jgi:KUP system potassium uptake protein
VIRRSDLDKLGDATTRAPDGRTGLGLVVGALGVVFGDIGTSPLYALQECLGGRHGVAATPDNVFGVTSLIVWALTFVVTIKYLVFLMRADNRGEGGIMALLALVPQRLRRNRLGRLSAVPLLVIAGAALLYGDGVITPAISVLSAIEGLEVASTVFKPYVVPLTVGILAALFAVQARGTGRIGRLFGPIMILWFATMAVLGARAIVNVPPNVPSILAALSPIHGVRFFADHGFEGARILGSVVLAVTGAEALYADMGHFGRRPIRIAWLALAYPALVLCYLGQAATVLENPAAAARPFFALVPSGGWTVALVALAAPATIIASQALISGVFSLTHQAIQMGYFPRLTVRHTGHAAGEIYLPLVNWTLAGACIALVLIFQASGRLASAYGLAVSGTMLVTSIVFYVVIRHAWGWSLLKAGSLLFLFASVDLAFVLANGLKFLDGGYLPFAIGLVVAVAMASWRIGRSLASARAIATSRPVDAFLSQLPQLIPQRLPGTCVCMASSAEGVPDVLVVAVERLRALHQSVVLLTVTTEQVPMVIEPERVSVRPLGQGLYRANVSYGFRESPNIPAVLDEVLRKAGLDARPGEVQYLVGRKTIVPGPYGRMNRILEGIFAFLARNARNPTDYFNLPVGQVVEVGTRLDL